jgi:superfamily II DNA/RNA helicase
VLVHPVSCAGLFSIAAAAAAAALPLCVVCYMQAVVFCNRKPSAEWLARRLTAAGCPAAHLSSDLPQTEVRQRDKLAARMFVRVPLCRCNQPHNVLKCWDLAASRVPHMHRVHSAIIH